MHGAKAIRAWSRLSATRLMSCLPLSRRLACLLRRIKNLPLRTKFLPWLVAQGAFLLERIGDFRRERMAEMISLKKDFETDLYDTLTYAAKWTRIAKLVSFSGNQVLFDDFMFRHGRDDYDFRLASTEHSIKFLGDLYDFVADDAKRKSLRTFFRQILDLPAFREGGELAEMVQHLKQRVDEHDFLAKHNCHPPDRETDA
jgi:hypothetical protein